MQECTTCGVCAEVCPILPYSAANGADAKQVVGGVLDILQGGNGNPAAADWVLSCAGSGVCIKECPEKINPRRMLLFARNALKGRR